MDQREDIFQQIEKELLAAISHDKEPKRGDLGVRPLELADR
jgi:hypothetical protein